MRVNLFILANIALSFLGFIPFESNERSVLPLQLGQEWHYVVPQSDQPIDDSLSYRIQKDTSINDTAYSVFEKVYHGKVHMRLFLRNDRGRVYFRRSPVHPESLYLPSRNDTVGHKFGMLETRDSLISELIQHNGIVTTPIQRYDSLLVIRTTNQVDGSTFEYYFSERIGLVAVTSGYKLILYFRRKNI